MAIASGANARIALKKQGSFGTAASGNFLLMPVRSFNVQPSQGFDRQPLIGLGRQPRRAARDVITVAGTIEVPIDVRYIGHWLTGLLGAPTTTGSSSPYTHVWTTAPVALPAYTIETQLPDITTPLYMLYKDVMIDRMSINWEPTGFPFISLSVTATSVTKGTSSGAGTPTSETYEPFSNLVNFCKKDGSDFAKILAASVEYNNALESSRYVGGGGAVGDISPGPITITGSIRSTVADATNLDLGTAATIFDLQVGWEISASKKLTFEFEQVELGQAGTPLTGGGRIELNQELSASYDQGESKALTVTLITDQSTY